MEKTVSRALFPGEIPLMRCGKGSNTATPMPVPFSAVSGILANINLIEVFAQSDLVGQAITVVLAVFSVFAWSLMLGKHFELKKLKALNEAFEYHLRDQRRLFDAPPTFRAKRAIPYGDLFADALEAYVRSAQIGRERGEQSARSCLEQAENAIQRALARQTLRYESSMIFLASIVSGAPFLGLLGTVWGVMVAFSAVATQQTASIQTLAPGVAAALLTTVAGLIVAIPSVFGYNYLLTRVKVLITEIENYASSLADRIELEATASPATAASESPDGQE